MRRLKWFGVIGAFCLVTSMIFGGNPLSSLLTDEDYQLEAAEKAAGRPALSSPLDATAPWESYNQWSCFPSQSVELLCVEIDYGGQRMSPTIIASKEDHRFEYSLDPTFRWDCEATLDEWRHLIDGPSEVCLFAARLQPLEDNASLWVLSQLKSEHGYWKEEEAYRRTQREENDEEDGDSGFQDGSWRPSH